MMANRLGRILLTIVLVLVVLAVVLGGLGVVTVRRSFPQVAGSLRVPGLEKPVEVYRDPMGVPQIYAQTAHDLFMAQGFLHAQDRFWQMDFWRHIGSGRLAEMFGESQVESDKFLRTMGWARIAEQEVQAASPGTRAAYLVGHQGASLSLEYAILGLLHPDYHPEPWTPVNTLTWAKVMAWDLRGNMDTEIQRAMLLKTMTPEQVAELYPPYPSDHPVIIPSPAFSSPSATLPELSLAVQQSLPLLTALSQRIEAVNALTGGGLEGLGSNDWVIAGSHTTTGTPILADDMHLDIQMPSIWYEDGLHCLPASADCPYDVTGFSFPGAPGVIVGHNAHIAWGVTNTGPDVQDLYIEKVNPAKANQYEVNGKWVDMTVIEETIHIAGGTSVPLTVRSTRHGPVLSDVEEDLSKLGGTSGLTLPSPYAVALRWTALVPGTIFEAVLAIDRAANWDEFRGALRDWNVPSQNFVFADTEGNIGYQMPGAVPIRASGDGTLPVPGWTDEYEWTGTIPFDELPYSFNPPQGFIATANNAVVGPDYPHLITTEWDYGYRAARIVQLIQAKPKLSIEDIQGIHGDDFNAMGPVLIPLLAGLHLDDPKLAQDVALLQGWDDQNAMDSAPAALFNVFWRRLMLRVFGSRLPKDAMPNTGRASVILTSLLQQPDSPWWDNPVTSAVEGRDAALRVTFQEAVAETEQLLGKDPARWKWGSLHTATFRNQTLGESGIGPIEALFNRGPFATAGGPSIVNATSWDPEAGYEVTSLPSERMIVDLGNLDNSLMITTTGESGHAFHPHYIDMADPWRLIQYRPMAWTLQQAQSTAAAHLTLLP
jgi:penicillin amidase